MLDIFIQIVLAIFLILIMGFIAYSIFDREYVNSIKIFNTNKHDTEIFKGIYEFDSPMGIVETFNKDSPYYKDLNPSVNQNGGAEYSYNFWLYYNIKDFNNNLIDNTAEKQKYIVLFYKGLQDKLPYNQYNYSCDTVDHDLKPKANIVVKNPLVKLSNDGTELIVEYNNINHPDTFNSSSEKLNCRASSLLDSKKNKLGIKDIDNRMYNKTFNMVTIVMQENPANEDELFVNRTNCKIYFNGTLISDRSTLNNELANENNTNSYSTVMKKNAGYLYLNPYPHFEAAGINSVKTITESDEITQDVPLKMANLTYHNYALSSDDVLKLYNSKFDNTLIKLAANTTRTFQIGNKVNFDMYDTDNEKELPIKPI
jgi:hypothetical protein